MNSSSRKDRIRELAMVLNENQIEQLLKLHDNWQLDSLFDLLEQKPEIVDGFLSDRPSKEPVSEYITELGVRRQLLDKIDWIAHQVNQSYDNHMALFAVLMVAPIEVLQSRAETLEINHLNNNKTAVKAMLTQWQEISLAGTQAFAKKKERHSESTTVDDDPQASSIQYRPAKRRRLSQERLSSTSRDSSVSSRTPNLPYPDLIAQGMAGSPRFGSLFDTARAARICITRDHCVCCFTGMPVPVAAHIFPSVGSELSSITAMVEIFWGADVADRLSTLMNGDQNVSESPQNLISLNRQLHWWFNNGRMALKPLRKMEDGSITVQFHWLKQGPTNPDMTIFGESFDELLGRAGVGKEDNQFLDRNNAHRPSGLSLETGQTFTFQAWRGLKRLPNFDLLQLSWDLRRVAAISGASQEPKGVEYVVHGDWLYDNDKHCDNGKYYGEEEEDHYNDYEDYEENEGHDDQDGGDIDAHLGTWEENQHARIHQWMGDVEVENGSGEEGNARKDTQSNV